MTEGVNKNIEVKDPSSKDNNFFDKLDELFQGEHTNYVMNIICSYLINGLYNQTGEDKEKFTKCIEAFCEGLKRSSDIQISLETKIKQ